MDNTQLEYWTCTVGEEGRKETNIRNERERERERERGLLQFLSYSHQLPSFVFFAENKSLR
jgi:hypothetical protein